MAAEKAHASVVQLKNQWFIVCESPELARSPSRGRSWARRSFFFGTARGRPGALLDRCPHRNVPALARARSPKGSSSARTTAGASIAKAHASTSRRSRMASARRKSAARDVVSRRRAGRFRVGVRPQPQRTDEMPAYRAVQVPALARRGLHDDAAHRRGRRRRCTRRSRTRSTCRTPRSSTTGSSARRAAGSRSTRW